MNKMSENYVLIKKINIIDSLIWTITKFVPSPVSTPSERTPSAHAAWNDGSTGIVSHQIKGRLKDTRVSPIAN